MVQPDKNEQFWVSNISKMDVSLTDLGLTIPARKTVNLLDKKHYFFTKEELINSAVSGSIFKKRKKIVVRKLPPTVEPKKIIEVSQYAFLPSRARRASAIQTEEIRYEELEIPDEVYAEQTADLTDHPND